MIYTDLTIKAMKIATEAHNDSYDKSGVPYIFHPIHLAEQMDDEYSTCCALLHDVVENTEITFEDLEFIFPKEIINPLKLLTRNKKVDYFEYVKNGLVDPIFRKVKKADLVHNSDLSRLQIVTEKDIKRVEKYSKALEIIDEYESSLKPFVFRKDK